MSYTLKQAMAHIAAMPIGAIMASIQANCPAAKVTDYGHYDTVDAIEAFGEALTEIFKEHGYDVTCHREYNPDVSEETDYPMLLAFNNSTYTVLAMYFEIVVDDTNWLTKIKLSHQTFQDTLTKFCQELL